MVERGGDARIIVSDGGAGFCRTGRGCGGVVIGGLVWEMRDGKVGRVGSSREILAVILSGVCVSA